MQHDIEGADNHAEHWSSVAKRNSNDLLKYEQKALHSSVGRLMPPVNPLLPIPYRAKLQLKGCVTVDRKARNMLHYMKTSNLLQDGGCLFVDFYESYCASSKLSEEEASACIRYLKKSGYIRYGKNQHGSVVGFELEHKAYHTAYFSWVAFRSFMIKSVFVPIVVSAITAFITVLITRRL